MAIQELDDLRDEFKCTLDADVKSLVRLYKKDSSTAGRPGEWLRAINRSALVLISASIENYIEDLVCAGLLHLCNNRVIARKYPENFRLWQFTKDANMRSLSKEDSKNLIKTVQVLYSDVRELNKPELNLDRIRDKFSNPNPKNVNWIMGLLDKDDYCDLAKINLRGTENKISEVLSELSTRRNEIAHGNANQNPSIDDVERLLKFASLLSTKLKKDVTTVIESCMR